MSSTGGPRRPDTVSAERSHAAFASVDSLVSRPIVGSDNASSWQSFSKDVSSKIRSGTGAAPILPVKRADRLGTGLRNRDDEIRHENEVRKQAGDAPVGSGYTNFKRKVDEEEIATKKRAKLIADRVRPDEKRYYIACDTFDGWKEDYVFTTRDRGTGYYWDGMDTLKKQLGISISSSSKSTVADDGGAKATEKTKDPTEGDATMISRGGSRTDELRKKKRKKKKKKIKEEELSVEADVGQNPMDQISEAIRRQNEAQMHPPGFRQNHYLARDDALALTGSGLQKRTPLSKTIETQLAAKGWERAKDPNTNKCYYFNRSSGERQWHSPLENKTGDRTNPSTAVEVAAGAAAIGDDRASLPEGWAEAEDPHSGKTYYYRVKDGKTTWTLPS